MEDDLSQYETVTYGEGQTAILTTLYDYDDAGRLVKSTQPDGRYTQTIYNSIGKAWKTRDLDGRWTEYFYSDRGEQVGVLYWDNTTEATAYTETGKQDTHTDREGIVTKYEYDAKGRQSKVYRFYGTADEAMTETRYDSTGRVVEEFDALRNRTAYQYDAQGRRTITTDALGNYSKSTYDTKGNLATTETCSAANVCTGKVRYAYDNQSRRVATIHVKPDLTELVLEQSGYTLGGRLHTKTDANGNVTEFGYTPTGRLAYVVQTLVTETGPESLLTEYTYDSRGNKLTQTDALERTTLWEYDQYGRLKKHTLPLGQYETYTYNTDGTLATKTDFNGDTTTYTYDAEKRLTGELYADGATIARTYYEPSGRPHTVVDAAGTTTYEYYPTTALLKKQFNPDGTELRYAYDKNGNRTGLTTCVNAVCTTATYHYTALSQIDIVTDHTGAQTGYTYTIYGKPEHTYYSNGTEANYLYDDLGRLEYMENKAADNSIISSFDYTLDANGNRTKVVEESGRMVEYRYDSLNRLTQEKSTNPDNSVVQDTYTLGDTGNRLAKDHCVDAVCTLTSYTYDANDRILTETTGANITTYSYDLNGNLREKKLNDVPTDNYLFDKKNRLILVATATDTVAYTYNSDGIRTSKTVNGVATNYLIDSNTRYAQVVAEHDDSGTVTAEYLIGNDLIAQKKTGTTSYFHYDGLGSTRSLTSESGTETDRYTYDAYGQLIAKVGTTANDYLFTGEQYDGSIGQYYLRARYYNPANGRFLSRDTWAGNLFSPITLNKYVYGNASPAGNVDPSGRYTINLVELSVTMAVNGIISAAASEAIDYYLHREVKKSLISALQGFAVGAVFGGVFHLVKIMMPALKAARVSMELAGSVDDAVVASSKLKYLSQLQKSDFSS